MILEAFKGTATGFNEIIICRTTALGPLRGRAVGKGLLGGWQSKAKWVKAKEEITRLSPAQQTKTKKKKCF